MDGPQQDTDQTAAEPAYWYKDYWLHRINREGVEYALERFRNKVPCLEKDALSKEHEHGDPFLFYWKILFSPCNYNGPEPTIHIKGKALFGKASRDSSVYMPVVHIIKDRTDPFFYRLYASRDYRVGDAILFVPKFEEESGECVLGGGFARISNLPSECNSYVTPNRTLRCITAIRDGEEIVRCPDGNPVLDRQFENIDRVVVCMESMSIGRLGLRFSENDANTIVFFEGDRIESSRKFHVHLFKNYTV